MLTEKCKDVLAIEAAKQQGKLDAAKQSVLGARGKVDNSPSAEDFLGDFSPSEPNRVFSDADGRFSFACSHNKEFVIFTKAKRDVLNKTEKYFWLLKVPNEGDKAEILLNNNNTVSVDPDNFFTLKPK